MNFGDLEKEIDKTAYWDMLILDVQAQYFGDEVYVFIENNQQTCWKINFLSCYNVSYETDANWRGNFKVKDTGPLSGYYGQDISIKPYEADKNFIESKLDLTIMTMRILCKDIFVEEVNLKDTNFFWKDKKKIKFKN